MNLNVVPKLFSKTVGNVVKAGEKITGAKGISFAAPENAKTYDFMTGFGKKGDFQHYVFKDDNGNVVRLYTRYDKGNNRFTDEITDIDISHGTINTKRERVNIAPDATSSVDEVKHSSMLTLIVPGGRKHVYQRSFMTMTPKGDRGGLELLQSGEKPVGFSHKYNWDGAPTQIEYKNALGQKLDLTEEEKMYLPFIHRNYILYNNNGQIALATEDFTKGRVQEKINLAQIIQEKLHDIEGILPRAKAVKCKDLHSIKTSGMTLEEYQAKTGITPLGEHLSNGQINLVIDVENQSDGLIIMDKMAHEMQHAADAIIAYKGGEAASNEAMKRVGITEEQWYKAHEAEFANGMLEEGKKFIQKVIDKKGLAQKGTPEYEKAVDMYEAIYKTTAVKDLKSIEQHDNLDIEKRAINREFQQMTFVQSIVEKAANFLAPFIKTQ